MAHRRPKRSAPAVPRRVAFVDTHGYTEINFAVFGMVGMRFCPRASGSTAPARDHGVLEPVLKRGHRASRRLYTNLVGTLSSATEAQRWAKAVEQSGVEGRDHAARGGTRDRTTERNPPERTSDAPPYRRRAVVDHGTAPEAHPAGPTKFSPRSTSGPAGLARHGPPARDRRPPRVRGQRRQLPRARRGREARPRTATPR